MKFPLFAALLLFTAWAHAQTPVLERLEAFKIELEAQAKAEEPIALRGDIIERAVRESQILAEKNDFAGAAAKIEPLILRQEDWKDALLSRHTVLRELVAKGPNLWNFRSLYAVSTAGWFNQRLTPAALAANLPVKPAQKWELVSDLLQMRAGSGHGISPGLWLIADALPELGAAPETCAQKLCDGGDWLQKAGQNLEAQKRWQRVASEFATTSSWERATYGLADSKFGESKLDESQTLFQSLLTAFDARSDDQKKGRFAGAYVHDAALKMSQIREARGDLSGALNWAQLSLSRYFRSSLCGTCDASIRFQAQKRIDGLKAK